MKKILFIGSLLATLNLHAITLPCFGKTSQTTASAASPATRVAAKAVLDTSSTLETGDAFTLTNTVNAGVQPNNLTYSHSGKFVAVTNGGDNTVSVYAVDCDTGNLTEIEGSPFAAGVYPMAIAYSPCDAYATVTNAASTQNNTTDYSQDSISVYSVNSKTGAFTLIQTLTNATNPEIATPSALAYSPDGRFVAVTNSNNLGLSTANIAIYRVSKVTGKLTLANPPLSIPFPDGIAYSPNGKFVAVASAAGNSSTYQVDPITGNFFNPQPFTAGLTPFGIAYSHNGEFAAVANYFDDSVTFYTVNQVTGVFTDVDTQPSIGVPAYVAFSRDDSLLAVTNTAAGTVTVFCVDPITATITQTQLVDNAPPVTLVTTWETSGIQFAPCRDFAAVTSFGGDTVSVFSVQENVCP